MFKEGVFWVAYEQSAYIVWLRKKYKPTKKFIKIAGQEVVSVGFPKNALAGIVGENGALSAEKEEKHIVLSIADFPNFDNIENLNEKFLEWKNGLETSETKSNTPQKCAAFETTETTIIEKLKNFDISNATPLECMNFLAEMKKVVRR